MATPVWAAGVDRGAPPAWGTGAPRARSPPPAWGAGAPPARSPPPRRVLTVPSRCRCYNCGGLDHHAKECSLPPQPRKCHCCQSIAHMLAACPHRAAPPPAREAGRASPPGPRDAPGRSPPDAPPARPAAAPDEQGKKGPSVQKRKKT